MFFSDWLHVVVAVGADGSAEEGLHVVGPPFFAVHVRVLLREAVDFLVDVGHELLALFYAFDFSFDRVVREADPEPLRAGGGVDFLGCSLEFLDAVGVADVDDSEFHSSGPFL